MANEPITREEMLLNAVATGEAASLEPITREEMFLAKLGGADVTTPTPITRKEQFLQKAIKNGGNTGGGNNGGNAGGNDGWIGDGDTHIWITLHEGRTSPMLGVCPNGTVTVDWGDGTTPDVLTGTSKSDVQWTPNHEYAKAGDYVITLTVDGEMEFFGSPNSKQHSGILRCSSGADDRNQAYQTAVQKVEIGAGLTSTGYAAFVNCYSLESIAISAGLTSIGNSVFSDCYSLASAVISAGVTYIGSSAFANCHSLASAVIPEGVTAISNNTFKDCYSLTSIEIPAGLTSIGDSAFKNCYSLASIVIPNSVKSIGASAFLSCYGVRYYDFTKHTTVPTLSNTSAFTGISSDCEIRVPSAMYNEWIAATNWTTYASQIVAV